MALAYLYLNLIWILICICILDLDPNCIFICWITLGLLVYQALQLVAYLWNPSGTLTQRQIWETQSYFRKLIVYFLLDTSLIYIVYFSVMICRICMFCIPCIAVMNWETMSYFPKLVLYFYWIHLLYISCTSLRWNIIRGKVYFLLYLSVVYTVYFSVMKHNTRLSTRGEK